MQTCQSQMKLDINWKCYHYTRKWMATLESKNTKLKTENWMENRAIKGKKRQYQNINCQTTQLYCSVLNLLNVTVDIETEKRKREKNAKEKKIQV